MNQTEKALASFIRILNRLDGEALFLSDKDITAVIRALKCASLTASLNSCIAEWKRKYKDALSRCEGKKRYQDRKEAYKAHGASSSVYWCNRHQCWHASKKRSKTHKE